MNVCTYIRSYIFVYVREKRKIYPSENILIESLFSRKRDERDERDEKER